MFTIIVQFPGRYVYDQVEFTLSQGKKWQRIRKGIIFLYSPDANSILIAIPKCCYKNGKFVISLDCKSLIIRDVTSYHVPSARHKEKISYIKGGGLRLLYKPCVYFVKWHIPSHNSSNKILLENVLI